MCKKQAGQRENRIYLLPGFNTLVGEVREGSAGNEATHTGGDMQVPVFQDNLPLANHHLWGSTQLHALKDIVLSSLKRKHEIIKYLRRNQIAAAAKVAEFSSCVSNILIT